MRLERAAFLLLNTQNSIIEISIESGYQSPEAFARSFRKAFGRIPTEFRRTSKEWKLESPVGLHWNADWVHIDNQNRTWEETPVVLPFQHACVWRFIGNYGWLEQGWNRYVERFGDLLPPNATYLTIYLDNMWTHPVRDTMRADLGWLCSPDFDAPKGMRKIMIPGGCYVSSRFVDRNERNDAWSYIGGRYGRPDNQRITREAFDVYDRLPVPFDQAKTKVVVGRWDGQYLSNLHHSNSIVS
jgi:AraC family transcriptional regulator